MKNKNNNAYLIASVLKKNGFEAFYAGGCVRDFLLKKQPKDYDIATSALPDEIEKLFDRTNSIGKKCPAKWLNYHRDRIRGNHILTVD